jgi:predicted HTH transcriptional regulator
VKPVLKEQFNPDRTVLTLTLSTPVSSKVPIKSADKTSDNGITADNGSVDPVPRNLTRNICGLNCGLTEIAVLNHLIDNPEATQEEVASAIGKSLRTIETVFSKLKVAEIIHRDGSKKHGKWIVHESVNRPLL